MAENFTFPQSGDNDDAEHFGSLIGQANLSNYVETGLDLQNYNAAGPDIDVTTGKCFISQTSETASSSGDTILQTNSVVQIPSTLTLSLTDSSVNEIYVDPNFNTDDSGSVEATTGGVPAGALKIGEVDTTADTVDTAFNREPSITITDITDADGNTVYDGTTVPLSRISQGDGSGLDSDTVDNQNADDLAPTYDDGSTEAHIIGSMKFGAEGSSTTNTSYTTIAGSDITINPDDWENSSGELLIRFSAHLKHSNTSGTTFARMYRQNAASAVTGTEVSVTATDDWGVDDSGWINFAADSGYESYQIQLRTDDGDSGSYNSIILYFGIPV